MSKYTQEEILKIKENTKYYPCKLERKTIGEILSYEEYGFCNFCKEKYSIFDTSNRKKN